MAEGIGATLTKKAGPLPVWAWTGVSVALFAVFLIYRQRKAAAAAAAQAASAQSAGGYGATSTNLGTNTLSNLVPQAYPMPFQLGDVFTNVNTSGGTVAPPPTPNPPPKPHETAYVWARGDSWDSVGKKINLAPILLWEYSGGPAGFKTPQPGTVIHLGTLQADPNAVYANQAKIIAAQRTLVSSGYKPPAGQVV